jgi:hypothetical protein
MQNSDPPKCLTEIISQTLRCQQIVMAVGIQPPILGQRRLPSMRFTRRMISSAAKPFCIAIKTDLTRLPRSWATQAGSWCFRLMLNASDVQAGHGHGGHPPGPAKGSIILKFTDTGSGMPPRSRAKFSNRSTTKAPGKGCRGLPSSTASFSNGGTISDSAVETPLSHAETHETPGIGPVCCEQFRLGSS